MADQENRPPNWVALKAANSQFNGAMAQIAEVFQDIPGHFTTISTELEKLEHQPTNAQLQQFIQHQFEQVQERFNETNLRINQRELVSTLTQLKFFFTADILLALSCFSVNIKEQHVFI